MASTAQLSKMIPKILAAIGADDVDLVHQAMTLWANSEGIPDSYYNPWATTAKEAGAPSTNKDGVKRYKDLAQGVQAMVDTLNGHNSKDIKAALIAAKSLRDIYVAINSSKWCAGCQNGRYPVQLWQAFSRHQHAPPPSTAAIEEAAAQGESWGPHVRATAANLLQDRPTTQGAIDGIRHVFR